MKTLLFLLSVFFLVGFVDPSDLNRPLVSISELGMSRLYVETARRLEGTERVLFVGVEPVKELFELAREAVDGMAYLDEEEKFDFISAYHPSLPLLKK